MASDASRSGASADSYIGSLISLTSKSEIRYEGILYNINTEESSIGLRNVRSFGTEGRKKDGPQIPASDKIFEYILFRGTDIKDLQVKSSPPPQPAPQPAPLHNDPAIIQSHYSHPPPVSTSLPSAGSGAVADSSHTAQLGLPRSTFQGGLPPYQPGGSLGSWGSTPSLAANGSGIAMPPMYWPGYYAPPGGLPQLQQPSILRPPPGLSIPPSMQQPMQYPLINTSILSGSANLTEYPPPLLPTATSTPALSSTTLPSTMAPSQASLLASEALSVLMPNKPPVVTPATSIGPTLPIVPPLTSTLESISTMSQSMPSVVGSNPRQVIGTAMPYQSTSQPLPSVIGAPISGYVETSVPLVTPGQLLQPGPSTLSSSRPSQPILEEVDSKPKEARVKRSIPEPPVPALAEIKEPILPLPTPTEKKPNGGAIHINQGYRGRGRGRGSGYPRPVTRFTEDFDFIAMNEKFNKDEVWGHLGKSKPQTRDREADANDDEVEDDEDDPEGLKRETKPVYVKDDFFDSLSSSTVDRNLRNGRTKFSEQLKIDTETFGDFPRHRMNRGSGRGPRGGGRSRGSYYGGRGYGYGGRGQGRTS